MSAEVSPALRRGVTLATTDANQTIAATLTTKANCAYKVSAMVLAVETADYDEIGDYWIEGAFLNDGGTLAQSGSTRTIHTANETTLTGAVAFAVSGQDIQLKVTGDASTNLLWRVVMDVWENDGFVP